MCGYEGDLEHCPNDGTPMGPSLRGAPAGFPEFDASIDALSAAPPPSPNGPAFDLEVRWRSGGPPTVVRTNLSTVEGAVQQVSGKDATGRPTDLRMLGSDPGEPMWLLAAAPGEIVGVHATPVEQPDLTIDGDLVRRAASAARDFAVALGEHQGEENAALREVLSAVVAFAGVPGSSS